MSDKVALQALDLVQRALETCFFIINTSIEGFKKAIGIAIQSLLVKL